LNLACRPLLTKAEQNFQGLDDINQLLISRIDHEHVKPYTAGRPGAEQTKIKESYQGKGLLLESDASDQELSRQIDQCAREVLGAQAAT
jgi:hypothetical protein